MPNAIDLKGRRFGKLLVVEQVAERKNGRIHWRCVCDCGNVCEPQTTNLTVGNSKACGRCRIVHKSMLSNLKHGATANGKRTPTYRSWASMNRRVKHRPEYAGVSVDAAWRDSFVRFLEDMGERPTGTTIDRIDGTKGYYKENCRWATPTQQTRNRRTTRRFTIGGETKTVAEWAEVSGLSFGAAEHRLRKYGGVLLPNGC